MSTVTVGTHNYFDADNYQAFTYSSQKTDFPASNVLNYKRRSKVHRTDGYWVVTSANKGIVLQTSAGVNQTVNIAEGTYTTDATFLAAVDTALTSESSGAAFTVTRDSTTGKIKLTSDGAGGTVFRLMCTNASFTAASLLGFSTASDLTGALTYTADTLKINTEEFYVLDCGTAVNPKMFAMWGERNSDIKISSTATVRLQGNSADSWSSPGFSQTLTYNEIGMGLFDSSGFGAYRYWRVHLSDVSNVLGYLENSGFYLGDAFVAARGAAVYPLDQDMVSLSESMMSRSGNRFLDEVQDLDTWDFAWGGLTLEDKEALEDFIRTVGRKPFPVFFDPNEVFSSDYQRQIRLVHFDSNPRFRLVSPNNYTSDWSLREEV